MLAINIGTLHEVSIKASRLAQKTVGVIGSGFDSHNDLAVPLGRLLGELGVNLLTGGGRGVMESVARAFVEANHEFGISIGVLPASRNDASIAPPGYPNPFVQLAIATHLPDRGQHGHLRGSRNHINVLSSDVVVALPGSFGTESEVRLAQQYGKPTVIFYADPASINRLPPNIARYREIGEIEIFLRHALDLCT